MLLKNRVALVTGGAKGIGRGVAERFAREGARVVIADILLDEAEKTRQAIEAAGGTAIAIQCDVTKSGQVRAMVDAAEAAFGKIDILVNNAGAFLDGVDKEYNLAKITEEEWDRMVDLNLKSAFLCSKEVAPRMQANGYGKIVNISSSGATNPPRPSALYTSPKAGLLGLTFDMAAEFAPHNITVNAIQPGPIRTSFYDGAVSSMSAEEKDEFFRVLGEVVPMQRVGTTDDIAGAVLFFASDLSSYVTGVSLLVAGGLR